LPSGQCGDQRGAGGADLRDLPQAEAHRRTGDFPEEASDHEASGTNVIKLFVSIT